MIVRDQPPELSPEDEADLVAFVDGRLDPEGRARVETRAARDPAYKSALLHQQVGRDAVTAAAEATGAPLALKTRVEELGAARGRHKGDKRSTVRTRLGGLRWPTAGLAAGAVAVALGAVVLVGGGPGVEDVAAAALRPPTAAIAPVAAGSKVLNERVADVRFPNYLGKFGWKAVGTRDGRDRGPRHPHRLLREGRSPDRLHRRLGRGPEGSGRRLQGDRRGRGPALAARQGPQRRHLAPPRPHLRALLQGRPAQGAPDARRLEGHGRGRASRRRRRRPRARAPRAR